MFSGIQFKKPGVSRSLMKQSSMKYAVSCPARNGTYMRSPSPRSASSSKSTTPQGTPRDGGGIVEEPKPTILSFLEASSVQLKAQMLDSKVNSQKKIVRKNSGDTLDFDDQDFDSASVASETFGVFQLDDDDCKPCGW